MAKSNHNFTIDLSDSAMPFDDVYDARRVLARSAEPLPAVLRKLYLALDAEIKRRTNP